jgi:hypothetical protein
MADSTTVADHDQQVDALQAWASDMLAPALTREELVEQLSKVHVEMSARQMRSWASYGIIPPPTRRAPPGSVDGKARALYPPWMFHVLLALFIAAEKKGATIADLKAMAPGLLRRAQEEYVSDSLFVRLDESGLPVRLLTPRIPRGLHRALWSYAERYNTQSGAPVQRMTLTLHCDDGRDIQVPIEPLITTEGDDLFPDVFITKDPHEG